MENGKIKGINGQRDVDFVVTKDGELVIGKKHHTLGNRQDVLAAGEMRLGGDGKVRAINNLSGHYRPSIDEAANFHNVLRNTGLDLDNTILDVYRIDINEEGLVTNVTRNSTEKLSNICNS